MENKLTNYINTVRTKSKRYLLSLSLFLSGLLTNTVYADDPFAKTDALAQQGITKVQGIGVVTLGLAVVVTGLVYGFGGREVKAAIKKHWLAIAIAIIAVSAGPSIVEWGFNFVKG
ncbi:TrbC/VirB2 family protein [Streptococcus agalactiae]|uniref:TrbC/VirB2 family protein n=1 Tax=Streptococcus agalactiae TaxID=1311 RepID=UPI001C953A27|nr:TrbC/VirB2 family protein [Streptococcus agalactiae]MBY4835023.1 TrbC/VirB2 family protein [Streptococcus agalactiae]MBY5053199.1 TrbC/VirB2 family protein [Streptococcus agalactiae]